MLETEKQKNKKKLNGKRPKNPIKIVFLRGGHPKIRKMKEMDFFAKIAWHYLWQEGRKNAHFRAHYLFWPKTFFGPKQCKPEKNIKYDGFSGNCPKPKMTPFFWKRCFLTWVERLGFTNCVFEKLCSSENTIFIVFSEKHCSCNQKAVCWEKQKIYEK